MDSRANASVIKVTAVCLLCAALLAILPQSSTTRIRGLVRLAFQPGQRAALTVRDFAQAQWAKLQSDELAETSEVAQELAARARSAEFENRQLALTIRKLQQQLEQARRHGASQFEAESTRPLLTPRAVEARVIGHEILSGLKSLQLLDQGEAHGLREDQWVLDSDAPIVDAGVDATVQTGLPVFAGRCIVGRVAQAGRQGSSLQLLTASDFRARAIVADSRGILTASAPEGLLEGTGHGCRLTQVSTNQNIQVGDLIYSPPGFPVDAPMLFGVITSSVRRPGALHWDIVVEPRADLTNLRTVQIVTPALNPERIARRN